MIEIKDYQEKAILKLKEQINELLNRDSRETLVFKSPTGSGKTLMVAEFIKRLVDRRDDGKQIAFIWTAPRQLHTQSKEKLDKYYSTTRAIECKFFEDLVGNKIEPDEILFLNWESINKTDNVYIRENEQERNLSKIIENTKEDGTKIVLIIDESHFTAKTETSRNLINDIDPDVILEVSATPHIHSFYNVLVEFEDVRKEGMIKKEIAINPELDKGKVSDKSPDELVIECALKKRQEMLKLLEKEKSDINPLILIQLPDKKTGVIDRQEQITGILRDKFKITTENGKLGIYLSEEKTNLENIEMPDNDVQVLIFKQAIALGWDCPRAYILVMFRDMQSMDFTIQTVGRIMRMPEFKHYETEELNKGYVFTNLADINITEEVAKDYITIYEAKRREELYSNIDLNSIYLIRQREKTRLSGEFTKLFLEIAQKSELAKKINLKPKSLVTKIMVDGKILVLDKVQTVEHKGEMQFKLSAVELQHRFDLFVRGSCTPFAPADSQGRIRTALYKFFEKVIKIEDETFAQKIILGEENNQLFTDCINEAKEEYKLKIVGGLPEQRETEHLVWNVPKLITYNSKYKELPHKKAIMKPYFISAESVPEKDFIKLLENPKNSVKWWFKNGESDKKYLAVKYKDDAGVERGFYVDFVIMLDDGRIGIFDTKSGITAKVAKEKAEALSKYIKTQNQKHNKKLFGGIIIFKDESCRYNDNERYNYDENNLSDWKFLKL
ncbi:DEAD/DEAH box helicase family protein [archaeon]|nr:DEAD/DEAH box helicase family protein [Nanoarchaeota archaeon]MCG2724156.1 DEAD/DEAH box helicase family protein [archaeon]